MAVETNQYKNNRNLTLAESLLDHHEITVLLFPQRVWWGWLKGGGGSGGGERGHQDSCASLAGYSDH